MRSTTLGLRFWTSLALFSGRMGFRWLRSFAGRRALAIEVARIEAAAWEAFRIDVGTARQPMNPGAEHWYPAPVRGVKRGQIETFEVGGAS